MFGAWQPGLVTGTPPAPRTLPDWLAIVLVTTTSGAVLVIEILAGRMLAPYVGVSLETYTAIIGTILAGIAIGARAGGSAADRLDARRLISALLVVGGALAISSIPIVRVLGGRAGANGGGAPSVVLALFAFLPAATALSAVPPAVVKLQLRDLEHTGTTVGRLSAWSTAGAIAGTFLAGYVLVAFAAVTTLVVATGGLLIVGGLAFAAEDRQVTARPLLAASGIAVVSLAGAAVVEPPCEHQTAYYCVSIDVDPDRPTGRVLVLDDLRHSYVDLADPSHLEFWYVGRIADAIDVLVPAGPVDVVSIGAGAMTIPRWLRATRPQSAQTVFEIDPDLIELVDRELGFPAGPDIEVVAGDGRLTMRRLADDSADVVVGDAFGSRAVPFHLATREFVAEIARVLRPGGIYVVNLIDGPDRAFLFAEAATVRTVLAHVAVLVGPVAVDGFVGNSVIVASDEPIDAARWAAADETKRHELLTGAALDALLDDALLLTDDFAPVDQLITGAR